jgi:hypothetical protein
MVSVKKQVVGVNATRIVTGMTDFHSDGYFAFVFDVGVSVR